MPKPIPYTSKSGVTTWRVRFRDRGRSSSLTFTSEAAARVFCHDIEGRGLAAALDMQDTYATDEPTLDEVAEQFFDWKATRVRSARTITDYRRDYERWIAPTLGFRRAGRITQAEVQGWVDAMHAGTLRPGRDGKPRPAAAKSIADRHALLAAIYAWASSPTRGLVAETPTAGTDLPRAARSAPKGLRPAQWQALASALRQISPDAADLAAFLIGSGWRWSEAVALTTFGVEDDGAVMHVTVSQVARRGEGGVELVADAKSAAGLRRVRLDAGTAGVVRRRVAGAGRGGLVFTNVGRPWSYSTFMERCWRPAREVAGIGSEVTPHWLRHTHVALMVMAGAKLPELQARIGHASITTTIGVYGRMVTDVDGSALEGFAGLRDMGLGRELGGGVGA